MINKTFYKNIELIMQKNGSQLKANEYFDSEIVKDKLIRVKLLNSVQNAK